MATAAVTVWDRRPQRTSQPATVAATRCASGVYAPRMAFRGWPDEAVEFFEGLQADNTKTYWTAHKPVYEASVYAPMAGLLAELADEFGPGRIARPYRDVRFSADKSPTRPASTRSSRT